MCSLSTDNNNSGGVATRFESEQPAPRAVGQFGISALRAGVAIGAVLWCSCMTTALAADEAADEYDRSNKPNGQGTLDYLQETGQLKDTGLHSAYELNEHEGAVDPDEIPDNVLLQYDIIETHRYFDSDTGEEVAEEDRIPGRSYADILIRDISPRYYDFSFKQTHYSYNGGTEVDGSVYVDYIKGKEFFTYSYDKADLQASSRRGGDGLGEIRGVFRGLTTDQNGAAVINPDGPHIKAYFINNQTSNGYGSAIYSERKDLGDIEGVFIGNSATKPDLVYNSDIKIYEPPKHGVEGGAIWLAFGSVNSIKGVFIKNRAGSRSKQENKGGAIASYQTTIDEIDGLFIANCIWGTQGADRDWGAVGGAIINAGGGKIGSIKGDFIANKAKAVEEWGETHGGAVYNYNIGSRIESIVADFIANSADSTKSVGQAWGGAIANHYGAEIGEVIGEFNENCAVGTGWVAGGAIYNDKTHNGEEDGKSATIDSIKANFIRNYVYTNGDIDCTGKANVAAGGAIANYIYGLIVSIESNFYDNYARTEYAGTTAEGGAIANFEKSHITSISGDFIRNYVKSVYGLARGGAIYAQSGSTIKRISGNFFDNYAYSENGIATAGAIRNEGEIEEIYNAVFVNNYAKTDTGSMAHGGAIYNQKTLTITADAFTTLFQNNYIILGNSRDNEAVFSDGGTITLNSVHAGHIAFEDKINGQNDYKLLLTGHSDSYITFQDLVQEALITMDSINLHIGITDEKEDTYGRLGSAVMENTRNVEIRSGMVLLAENKIAEYKFNRLDVYGEGREYNGKYATFSVDVDLDSRVADLITVHEEWENGNKTKKSEGRVTLSALSVYSVLSQAELLENLEPVKVQILNLIVTENGKEWSEEQYAAYKNEAPIELSNQIKVINDARSFMRSDEIIAHDIRLDTTNTHNDSIWISGWKDNLAEWAEYTKTAKDEKSAEQESEDERKRFTLVTNDAYHVLTRDINKGNSARIFGRWLEIVSESNECVLDLKNHNLLTKIDDDQNMLLSNFRLKGVAGNAIQNAGSLTLDSMVLESDMTLCNNHSLTLQGVMDVHFAITTQESAAPISAAAPERAELVFDDNSIVSPGKTISNILSKIEHQDISLVEYHNTREPAAEPTADALKDDNFTTVVNLPVTQSDGKTKSAALEQFLDNSLEMQGGKLNLGNMHTYVLPLRNLEVKGGAIYVNSSGVDLKNEQMGGILAQNAAPYQGRGIIWLNSILISSDSVGKVTHIQFVNPEVGSAVKDNNIRNNTAMGPVYEYYVTYADTDPEKLDMHGKTGGNGYYTFVRTNNVNPAAQSGASNVQAGLTTALLANDYAFEHADLYADAMGQARTNHLRDARRYILVTPTKGKDGATAEESACGSLSAAQSTTGAKRGMWVRPYSSFERVPLHNGPKVSMSLYGALVGADTSVREHRNGWVSVFSGYLGYTGSHQKWHMGNSSRQNGGLVGATETLYKDNFYAAFTLASGISSGSATTVYGRESFHMFNVGAALRTGYTIALDPCAKYVLQPSLQLSYTYISMNDYTNGAGVRMESDAMNVFQVHPFVKFIMHAEDDWKPYLVGGFVWNVGDGTRFHVDGDRLPELSINPYAEYGLGIQKVWKERYTFYGQATGRSGGRQGFELSAGVRWNW